MNKKFTFHPKIAEQLSKYDKNIQQLASQALELSGDRNAKVTADELWVEIRKIEKNEAK